MLYYLHLLGGEIEILSFFRLFKYITFRAGGAAFSAFLLTYLLGPQTVVILKKLQATAPGHLDETIPEFGINAHKRLVPTMGGVRIVG